MEHDSCGVVAFVEKSNNPTKKNIDQTIEALITMNHRAGFINEEGDGVGVHLDIPKKLWQEKLTSVGENPNLVNEDSFVVGHFFIDRSEDIEKAKKTIDETLINNGGTIVYRNDHVTVSHALGAQGREKEPLFYQVALQHAEAGETLTKVLFQQMLTLEQTGYIHVCSLSPHNVVYKVLGAGDVLPKYYKDLASPIVESTITLGHNRYSTNTLSNFFRVQPFSILGHNGEINTISKLRDEAQMIGVQLDEGGSDSQDLNRIVDTFISEHGFGLFEALEILFPPIVNEIKSYPKHLQDLFTYIREAWGHFAQGPAGIITRYGDEVAFSVDSLGLRPVWMLETDTSFIFSSEQGILTNDTYFAEPKPLAPGEKVGLKRDNNGDMNVLWHDSFQEEVYKRLSHKLPISDSRKRLDTNIKTNETTARILPKVSNNQYAAFGWDREHVQLIEQMADKGVEPIRSLGHDAPLAPLHPGRVNVSDFIKESVAVVTNPAIDRDRETEHFSTRVIIGQRPSLFSDQPIKTVLQLESPLVIEGWAGKEIAKVSPQPSYDGILQRFGQTGELCTLSLTFSSDESLQEALDRLIEEATEAINNGAHLIVLDDQNANVDEDHLWIDPHLATSTIDQALTQKQLRRLCSIALRSGSIRSLHDIAVAFGLGANMINPYLMFATVVEEDPEPAQKLYDALNKGLEKIISTIGIHELRGYGRLFSAIGLNDDIAECLNIVNFLGGENVQYSLKKLEEDSYERVKEWQKEKVRPGKTFHIFPRVWKVLGDVASGEISYDKFREKLEEQEAKNPISIRHLTDFKQTQSPKLEPKSVDVSVSKHDLPFMISSMSFGSQNEVAFRAYAEAADQLNMISFNGEGGEIKDMLGKYPNTRGQQIASGRFGVNVELINSSNLLEIKIGQGAKPGEGGHLPGSKVTEKVAEARNATTGSDLISPSNNHDIYSIEDLAQMISELKTANDQAKVTVKVPIVPNIGTIAVGIAKAGADYITLSGFDGGTGAARVHALQHVGLPAEIGVKSVHHALLEAGLRQNVEIWADGGVKSAADALKLMLLGANRIGFGTLSMIAVGCTACRGCHLDTCHVGIATQIESEAQAHEHGLRRFVPRQFDLAVQGLKTMFTAFGEELQALTASLGFKRTQDLVGRSDLLEQTAGEDMLHLQPLFETLPEQEIAHIAHEETVEAEEQLAVAVGAEYLDGNIEELTQSREYDSVTAEQRNLASRVSCHRVRGKLDGSYRQLPDINLSFKNGSILGNGLGAYNGDGVRISIDGGAQDGVGKTAFGGAFHIFKSEGKNGRFYNGSVGKGVGYGAQSGTFIIQGNADARAGIRLSGADMIFGAQITEPIDHHRRTNLGVHANLKGFAFEYMTNGRGIVLGDPGPWICAGMTGGVVYLRHQPEFGLTREALHNRIAKGANVELTSLTNQGIDDVQELLSTYHDQLRNQQQHEEAEKIEQLLQDPEEHFLQVTPVKQQADPSVSTE
ncbi:glutamate synthase-related protein [Texcoconibacillus texcoconensis]|nr:glutamate synthase-related protein [Texcoconibacillus texcoconensis]